jgi:hypothetical protein
MKGPVSDRLFSLRCQGVDTSGRGGCSPAQFPDRDSVQGFSVAEVDLSEIKILEKLKRLLIGMD